MAQGLFKMAVNLNMRIIETNEAITNPDLQFNAFTTGGDIGDNIFAGYGATPYEALHDLIKEFEEAEIWRPD